MRAVCFVIENSCISQSFHHCFVFLSVAGTDQTHMNTIVDVLNSLDQGERYALLELFVWFWDAEHGSTKKSERLIKAFLADDVGPSTTLDALTHAFQALKGNASAINTLVGRFRQARTPPAAGDRDIQDGFIVDATQQKEDDTDGSSLTKSESPDRKQAAQPDQKPAASTTVAVPVHSTAPPMVDAPTASVASVAAYPTAPMIAPPAASTKPDQKPAASTAVTVPVDSTIPPVIDPPTATVASVAAYPTVPSGDESTTVTSASPLDFDYNVLDDESHVTRTTAGSRTVAGSVDSLVYSTDSANTDGANNNNHA